MRLLRWVSLIWIVVLLVVVLAAALLAAARYLLPLASERPLLLDTAPPDSARDIAPRARITLLFSQPMNPRSVERELVLEPPAPAALIWSDDFTTLTISPTAGLQPVTQYRVTVGEAAMSRWLRPLGEPAALSFSTAPAPVVTRVLPADASAEVPLTSPISVSFSRPMVPESALGRPGPLPELRFDPPLAGSATWLDPSTVLFRPAQPLRPATRYSVTIDAGLTDREGGVLGRPVTWGFSTPAPAVLATAPPPGARGVAPRAPVTLRLSQPLDEATIASGLVITPTVAGVISTALLPDSTQLITFTPTADWRPGATYTAELRAGLLPAGADARQAVPLAEGARWSFTAAPRPALIGRFPGEGQTLPPAQEIRLIFTTPLDEAALRAAAQLDPPAPELRITVEGTEVRIGADLQAATTYTLTLPADLVDRNGVPLGSEQRLRFATAPAAPALLIPEASGHFAQLVAGQPATLLVRRTNLSTLLFDLYDLDEATVVRALAFGEAEWSAFQPERYARPLRRSWAVPLGDPLNAAVEGRLPLTEDGGPLPSGTYYLRVRSPEGPRADLLLLVSRTRLALKAAGDEVVVWATDAVSGTTLAGLPVALYQDDALLTEGVTGPAGVWRWPSAGGGRSYVAIARSSQPGVAGAEMLAPSAGVPRERYRAFLTTDRAVYAPGEEVRIAGFVREVVTQTFALPPPGLMVELEARGDATGRLIYDELVPLGRGGVLSATIALPPSTPPGAYTLVAKLGDDEGAAPLARWAWDVASVADGRLSVVASLAGAEQDPAALDAAVAVRSSDGLPVAGAVISWTLDAAPMALPAPEGFAVGAPGAQPARFTTLREGSGVAGPDGGLRLTITDTLALDRLLRYRLVARVTAPDGASSVATADYRPDAGQAVAALRLPSRIFFAGEPGAAEVLAVTAGGTPLPGARVRLEVLRSAGEGQPEELVLSRTLTADAAGLARFSIELADGGEYRARASLADTSGPQVSSSAPLWVAEPGYVGWDAPRLIADRDLYRSGETATLLATLPYTRAAALVTLAGGESLTHTVELISAGEPLTVTLGAGDAPGAQLGLLALDAGVSRAITVAQPLDLATTLPVAFSTRTLSVTLAADQERYAPGATALLTITTADGGGRPAPADLILSVAGAATPAPDIVAAFAPRPPGEAAAAPELPAGPRAPVPAPGVAWDARLRTAPDGTLALRVRLPNGAAQLRAVVWAAAADAFGQAEAPLFVEQPIAARIEAPGFLRTGDGVEIAAWVENTSPVTRSVEVSLEADGVAVQSAAPGRRLTLAPGASERVVWDARVGEGESAALRVRVAGAGGVAEEIAALRPVLPAATAAVTAGGALVSGAYELPLDALGALEVDIAPPGDALARGAAVSLAAQPDHSLIDEAALLLLTAPLTDTRPLAQAALDRLVATQNGDGGWGWWPAGRSHPLSSALALEALAAAREAGLAVPERTRGLGIVAAEVALTRRELPAEQRAHALYALSLHGQLDRAALSALAAQGDALGPEAIAYLLLAQSAPEARESQELVRRLEALARRDGPRSFWQASGESAAAYGDAATTALVARALEHAGAGEATVGAARLWLAAARGVDGWPSAVASARAIAALAGIAPEGGPATSIEVRLDGEALAQVRAGETLTRPLRLSLPLSRLQSARELSVTAAGGPLLVSHRAVGAPAPAAQAPDTILLREYLDPQTGQPIDRERLRPGQVVVVRLTLLSYRPLAFLLLEDQLPSGAVNLALPEGDFEQAAVSGGRVQLARLALPPGIHEYRYSFEIQGAGSRAAPAPVARLASGALVAAGEDVQLQVGAAP